jgi:UDP-N-acetylmuramate--alanine ligase
MLEKGNERMIRLDDIRTVYFIGIGGIGMSALARYFLSRGCAVAGYDRTPTQLTRNLEASGMKVIYQEETDAIPAQPDLVIYTPAIPQTNLIYQHFRDLGIEMLKRSDVLGIISEGTENICIAGTHGKTTISTMTAHLLRHTGYGCNAFLGGISSNYDTNFWSHERKTSVIEADEFDRSFLKLSPDIAAISAMDPDHLDIYGTAEAMEEAFIEFSRRVRPGGMLFAQSGLHRLRDLQGPVTTYSLEDKGADIHASSPVPRDGAYHYHVHGQGWTLNDVTLNMGGRHNVENSLVAIGIAKRLGIPDEAIRAAIADFRGVRRRFEYRMRTPRTVYIDDYAHHPEELRALILSARDMFRGKRCTVVFQPHLFSRTRDFAEGFAQSLDLADEVLLLPIYAARELPMEGVDNRIIGTKMEETHYYLDSLDAVLHWLDTNKVELLITAGAGDIDQLAEPVTYLLRKKNDGR